MDHYYAECFGYMPPTSGNGSQRFTKASAEPFESAHSQRATVPRRPMTLQFGTDTQFVAAKESPSFMEGYSFWFPSESQEEFQTTVSPVAVEEPMQAHSFDCDISPLSPSTSSSASSYARSLSDCSPPPSGHIYTSDFGYNFPGLNAEHTTDIDETLFADLSNIEANLGSMGATDPWATINCHDLTATPELEKSQGSIGYEFPLGLYHDSKLPSVSSSEDESLSSSEETATPPTILHPSPAKSTDACDDELKTKPRVIRLVGEKHVDGQGLCYVYSDGTHCPKYIKGEPVNAKWGITKAGRPRKRLAQACMACRHRKIKCTPGSPKCEQCKRSGKTCRFENAPRGNQAKARAESECTTVSSQSSKKSSSGKTSAAKAKAAAARNASPTDFDIDIQ
ncbi:Zn(2)-C6 fungal-type DNA-binding domain protein [Ascosphaera apis ARSEF 7405]|uniref:Zn(2)-C6 fungal-type DNA-binding domain protein n=1 Tax=Ascosphaera apis ARSEF 7405 TaxID=392613 RepID=A0A168DR22_9EURO|nr:Zn(2)-C6 fungal-type DNA-binding domain protein [Ascosphaera apis ARSEF 7405]